jgi:hypothetical protein
MSVDYAEKYEPARDRLLRLMRDGAWHSWKELEGVAGNRYAARLHELKRLGYDVESEVNEDDGKRYRFTSPFPGAPQPKRVKVYLAERDAQLLAEGEITPTANAAVTDALASFQHNRSKL